MKRILMAAALVLAGCAGGVPPVGIGGPQGTRVYTGAGSPFEVYQSNYAGMTNLHRFLDSSLRQSPPDRGSVATSLEDILRNLYTMSACVTPEERVAFGPIVGEYEQWQRVVARGQTSGLLQAAEDLRVRINSELPPKAFHFPPAFPGEPSKTPAAAPTASAGVAMAAWKSSHADLVLAVKHDHKAGAMAAWKQIQESLRLLKPALDANGQTRVQVYSDFYERLAKDCRGFTDWTGSLAKDKALSELDVVSGLVASLVPPPK